MLDRAGRLPLNALPAAVPTTIDEPVLECFGPFLLLEKLGQGGYGVVYRARDTRRGTLVALKRLRPEVAGQPDHVARFHREMATARQLDHPHLVRCLEGGVEQGIPYLVMELLEGEDLQKLVNRVGPLPVAEACTCVREAALGLDHAHQKDVVHRDVKPGNLFVTPTEETPAGCRGQVKVLDLGMARWLTVADGQQPLTGSADFLGTPDYVAPEQVKDSRSATAAADVYSLGATLYFLLSGKRPFETIEAIPAKLVAVQNQEPRPLEHLRPDLPQSLLEIIRMTMLKDPTRRKYTAATLAEALRPFCANAERHPRNAVGLSPGRPGRSGC